MASTFFGLEIGRSGLQTHQAALDVTSHNMANASTPGYSRQRAEIVTLQPYTYPSMNRAKVAGQVGTGTDVASIVRLRDQLIDQQIQTESTTLGYWDARQQMLDKMELIVNEPTDSNIRTAMQEFWTAVDGVAKDPALPEARSDLREKTVTMVTTIRENYAQEKALRKDADDRIVEQVSQINMIADKIAVLNAQIGKVSALGDNPNDLMDSRDAILEELSKMVNIQYSTDQFNHMNISISGIALVDGIKANKILTQKDPDNDLLVNLKWKEPAGESVRVLGGSVNGLLQVRDQDIPKILNELNNFASTLITEFNALHRQGVGLDESSGNDFFAGTNAEDIDLSGSIKDTNVKDINGIKWDVGLLRIAAAGSVADLEGSGKTMMETIFQLKDRKILSNSSATMGEFLGAMVADLGERANVAKTKYDHQGTLIGNLDTRREEVCGVNLDEEMTNMVRFQHGYNAAAKIISTMDEMLDVLINRLKV